MSPKKRKTELNSVQITAKPIRPQPPDDFLDLSLGVLAMRLFDHFRASDIIVDTAFFTAENKEYVDEGKGGDIVKDLCNHVA